MRAIISQAEMQCELLRLRRLHDTELRAGTRLQVICAIAPYTKVLGDTIV